MSETPIYDEMMTAFGEGEDGHPLSWDPEWSIFRWPNPKRKGNVLPPKAMPKAYTRAKRETAKQ